MKKRSKLGVTFAIICGLWGTLHCEMAQATPSYICSQWASLPLEKDKVQQASKLLRAAELKMRENGFTQDLQTIGFQSVTGWHDPYSATIRVVVVKGIAFIVVSGPNSGECDRMCTKLRAAFQ